MTDNTNNRDYTETKSSPSIEEIGELSTKFFGLIQTRIKNHDDVGGSGELSTIHQLIESGLKKCVQEAAKQKKYDAIDLFRKCSVSRSVAFYTSVKIGDPEGMRKTAQYTNEISIEPALIKAVKYGHFNCAEAAVELGAKNIKEALRTAARYNRPDLMDDIIYLNCLVDPKNALTVVDIDNAVNDALITAVEYNHFDCMEMVVELGATNIEKALLVSANNRPNCMRKAVLLGAKNVDEALLEAVEHNFRNCAEVAIELGAKNVTEALSVAAVHSRECIGYLKSILTDFE